MGKIAIVNQRYGLEVNGGSEYYTRLIAEKLAEKYDVEVITTCAIDYMTWADHYKPGMEEVNGVKVRRFQVKSERKQKEFDEITIRVLDDAIRTEELEYQWIEKQGPYCPDLVNYICENAEQYDVFIFVTYLYYLTAMAMPKVAEKSILIPTAHDEPFLKFKAYKTVFEAPRGYVFLTDEEEKLVHERFDTKQIFSKQAAVGIDIPEKVDGKAFIEKYNIDYPYMIYVGRIDEGKKCHVMFQYFQQYKKEHPTSKLKLLLMGKAVIDIPESNDIVSLGFVSEQDKYNGIAASEFLILPSQYESLSISVLEAMALNKTVLVNGQCEVLKGHCVKSNGGLYYENYREFESTVEYLVHNLDSRKQMEVNAKAYVDSNYRWDVIVERLSQVIEYVKKPVEFDKKSLVKSNFTGKKIGFVTPWFGMNIQGGAESELRELVLQLRKTDLPYEVLTTCVQAFNKDWSFNFHKEGLSYEKGVAVRRFKADKRNTMLFDSVNKKLMAGEKISRVEQKVFVDEMINSKALYKYMEQHADEYSLFVYIPYMFGTTYNGVKLMPEKAVLIPCFHDESYFHMDIFKELYSKVAGIIYNARPEMELVESNYSVDHVKQIVMGIGMDTDISGDAKRFREKYDIESPFILYAGRKDAGKNVDTLVKYFCEYRKRNDVTTKLVLIGGGQIDIPVTYETEIIDLGFLPIQDKYDAYAAAELLCQPSHNESFSLVIMESWLCGRPVLVNDECAVTRNFAMESNGGLWFKDYFEFEASVNYITQNPDKAREMARSGKEYVLRNFEWSVILDKYLEFFKSLI